MRARFYISRKGTCILQNKVRNLTEAGAATVAAAAGMLLVGYELRRHFAATPHSPELQRT